MTTIMRSINIAMHIHLREFFCSFFALCRAVVPDWTWSTALETCRKEKKKTCCNNKTQREASSFYYLCQSYQSLIIPWTKTRMVHQECDKWLHFNYETNDTHRYPALIKKMASYLGFNVIQHVTLCLNQYCHVEENLHKKIGLRWLQCGKRKQGKQHQKE